ncbi:MAG: RHS repeat-associated core domain-containing protein [Bacteroidota bacterium]
MGSTSYITDEAGRVTQHLVYIPFGELLVERFSWSGEDANLNYLFNGKFTDRETGLIDYGARFYDPGLSIWTTVDPLMEKYPGWSPYNYTMWNPVMLVDPDGRQSSKNLYHNVDTEGFFPKQETSIGEVKTFDTFNPEELEFELGASAKGATSTVTDGVSSVTGSVGSAALYLEADKEEIELEASFNLLEVEAGTTLLDNDLFKLDANLSACVGCLGAEVEAGLNKPKAKFKAALLIGAGIGFELDIKTPSGPGPKIPFNRNIRPK